MADSLVKDLTKRTINTLAKITGVRLWSGKSGDADNEALGVEMSEMFSSAIVTGSSIDYKGLTPKGFYLSVATEDEKGIVEKANGSEVLAETEDKFLAADNQTKMREYWAKASNTANLLGKAKVWQEDGIGEGESTPRAFKFTVTFNTLKPDGTNKSYYPLPFTMPAGKRILYAVVNGVYFSAIGAGKVDNTYLYVDVTKSIHMPTNAFQFVFPDDGSAIYINTTLTGIVSCVLDVFAIVI